MGPRRASTRSRAPKRPVRRVGDVGERGLLERLTRFAAWDSGRLVVGYGDDAAVWDPDARWRRAPLVIATTDTMVEGSHFRLAWSTWEEVGRKLVASNVSDVAAMGGRPTLGLVSLACPASTPLKAIDSLYRGMRRECGRWGVSLAGGDSVRSDRVVLTFALLGEKDRGAAACRRSGLRVGQRIYVTGWPGESGAGLSLLAREGRAASGGTPWRRRLVRRHLLPTPRVHAGEALAKALPDLAMIDVSDGIDNELHLLAEASGAVIEVDLDLLPISASLRKMERETPGFEALGSILFGGEDYELLFATRADSVRAASAVRRAEAGLPVRAIGRVTGRLPGGRVSFVRGADRKPLLPKGKVFQHFALEGR